MAYLLPDLPADPHYTFTDGSRLGNPPASGAEGVLQNGHIAVCRVPGHPNSYKAEVTGILLGSTLSPPNSTLRVDCKGAIASTTGSQRPVRHAKWVLQARESLLCKNQSLEWIEGHTGHIIQERSDEHVKYASTLPLPRPAKASSPWDVVRHGEVLSPPHKSWTHNLIPSHSQENFHPSSWKPLRHHRLAWHKWLFGLQSRVGFSHYASFWRDDPPVPGAHTAVHHMTSACTGTCPSAPCPTRLSMRGCPLGPYPLWLHTGVLQQIETTYALLVAWQY